MTVNLYRANDVPIDGNRLQATVSQGTAEILLVGKPGHLRDALQSLVSALPGVGKLVTADTELLALRMVREARPRLVLVGSSLPDAEVFELLRQIKEERPESGCLVFTESAQKRRLALTAGADRVVSVGLPAGQLFFVIQQMLDDVS